MENQEVQHLQINIPEWLANSNDEIVIICSDGDGTDGQHEGDILTVPFNSILDGTEQNQVVVQMPTHHSHDEIPHTTGTILKPSGEIPQTFSEIAQSPDDASHALPSEVSVPKQEGIRSDLAAGDSSIEDQNRNDSAETIPTNIFGAGEEYTQQRTVHVMISEADTEIKDERPCPVALYKRVDNIDDNDEDSTNSNQTSVTSNLKEHDYLADKESNKNKQPKNNEEPTPVKVSAAPTVSRRSKRKAAMSPRRWCRAGCCDDGKTHGQAKAVKVVDEGTEGQAPAKKLKQTRQSGENKKASALESLATAASVEDPIPTKRSKQTKSSAQDKNCKETNATSASEKVPKTTQRASKRAANAKTERAGQRKTSEEAQVNKNEESGMSKLEKDTAAVEIESKPAKRGTKKVSSAKSKAETSEQTLEEKMQMDTTDEGSPVDKSAVENLKEISDNEIPQSKVKSETDKRGSKRAANGKSEAETSEQKKMLEEVQMDENEKTDINELNKEIVAAVEKIMEKSDPTPEAENVDPAEKDDETKISLTKKKSKKATKKSTEPRHVDSYTISPDGIDIDEEVPINIIKATKPEDLTAVDTEQLGFNINDKFECICGQTFTQKRSLIRHFRRKKVRADGIEESGSEHFSKYPIAIYPNTKAPRKNPVPKTFQCPHCPRVLGTKGGMDYHIMSHTGNRPILCSLCGKAFKSKQLLDQHFVVHSDSNELPHKCDECGRTYLTAARLRAHEKTHGERMYQCDQCSQKFVMSKDLKKHSRIHTGEKPFTCDFCTERFHFSQDVKRHLMKVHIDKAQFKCPHCPKNNIFFTEEKYDKHMRIHGNSDFHCEICSQNFPSYTTFRNHQVLHSGKNPFTCRYENCGQEFKCANDRYLHERKVHDTNQLFCPFCNIAFKKQTCYDEHIKKHKDSSFKCRVDQCDMSFHQPHARLRHEKMHKAGQSQGTASEEPKKKLPKPKPPPPEIANTATVYQCGMCWKTYKNYQSLRDHVREHGQDMPYECRVVGCHMRFKRVYHRRRHEQSHSTDEIINSVLDSQLRANEESIEFSEDESVEGDTVIIGDQNVGRTEEVGELSAELAAQALTAASTAAANANREPADFEETEIAVQFVMH